MMSSAPDTLGPKFAECQHIPLAVVNKIAIENEGGNRPALGIYPDSTQLRGHFEVSND